MVYLAGERVFALIMQTNTKQKIKEECMSTFSKYGYESLSIRKIADKVGVSQSVIYNYYPSKDVMLKSIFDEISLDLGVDRKKIEPKSTLDEDIKDRVRFQFENADRVNFILKYFFHYKNDFAKNEKGYVPQTAYKHIKEVLEKWSDQLVFEVDRIDDEAKIITHAINGFVLEYYPNKMPKEEQERLTKNITEFISRSIKKPEEVINNAK